MKFLKTLRTRQPTFSTDKSVDFYAPKSWHELTQEQLHYVLMLMATFADLTVVKTYMFVRFCGLHVAKKDSFGWICYVRTGKFGLKKKSITIQAWQIEYLIKQFDYIDTYVGMGVRLDDVRRLHAVDVNLHGLRFADYLSAEKYYQAYCRNKDDRFLASLARELYRKKDGSKPAKIKLDKAQMLGTFLWYSYVKDVFAKAFPHFFKKVNLNDPDGGGFDLMESVNVQIRALTDGDVTKEQLIFDTDCWRALTELDAKARESEDLRKKMKK